VKRRRSCEASPERLIHDAAGHFGAAIHFCRWQSTGPISYRYTRIHICTHTYIYAPVTRHGHVYLCIHIYIYREGPRTRTTGMGRAALVYPSAGLVVSPFGIASEASR